MTTSEILSIARGAKSYLGTLDADSKNKALLVMANSLAAGTDFILKENALDLDAARGTVSDVMLDRLMLDKSRIEGMAQGIREVVELPDPVGRVLSEKSTADGLIVKKVSVPMGVIAIIYESRPNVTSDAAALCIKSGNVCILRGGKEAYRSSHAIVSAMKKGLTENGFNADIVNILDDTTRAGATELMKANGFVDMLIPRGGAGLINACVRNATVPCIQTGTGICHIYVDGAADLPKAVTILDNAKTSRPSVCNAEEQCLVSEAVAPAFLPALKKLLVG